MKARQIDAASQTRYESFHLAQPLHVGPPGAENVADIRAAGQVAHAKLEQPGLKFEILPDPAHTHPFVVRAGCAGGRFVGLPHPRMVVLAWYAHLGAEIGRADMQHVDAVDRRDRVRVFDRLRRFEHRDQQGFLVEVGVNLALGSSRITESRPGA